MNENKSFQAMKNMYINYYTNNTGMRFMVTERLIEPWFTNDRSTYGYAFVQVDKQGNKIDNTRILLKKEHAFKLADSGLVINASYNRYKGILAKKRWIDDLRSLYQTITDKVSYAENNYFDIFYDGIMKLNFEKYNFN